MNAIAQIFDNFFPTLSTRRRVFNILYIENRPERVKISCENTRLELFGDDCSGSIKFPDNFPIEKLRKHTVDLTRLNPLVYTNSYAFTDTTNKALNGLLTIGEDKLLLQVITDDVDLYELHF